MMYNITFTASLKHEFPAESCYKIRFFLNNKLKLQPIFCEFIPLYGLYIKHLGKRFSTVLDLYIRGPV